MGTHHGWLLVIRPHKVQKCRLVNSLDIETLTYYHGYIWRRWLQWQLRLPRWLSWPKHEKQDVWWCCGKCLERNPFACNRQRSLIPISGDLHFSKLVELHNPLKKVNKMVINHGLLSMDVLSDVLYWIYKVSYVASLIGQHSARQIEGTSQHSGPWMLQNNFKIYNHLGEI